MALNENPTAGAAGHLSAHADIAGMLNDPAANWPEGNAAYEPLKHVHSGSAPVGFAHPFMQTLDTDSDDAVLVVAGDSISTDATEWAGLLADKLAEQYPAFTVKRHLWNPTTEVYESPTTVQTGTGANTLDVYISAEAGMASDYHWGSRFDDVFPVTPDLVLVATGHNDTPGEFLERNITDAVQRVGARFPDAAMGFVFLNPKTSGTARYEDLFAVWRQFSQQAGEEGVGILDLSRAFLDRTGGYDDLVPDGTHPNADGAELLAATAFDLLLGAVTAAPSARRRHTASYLFLSALNGVVEDGSPAVALNAYSAQAGMAFDDTTNERILFPHIILPWWWRRISIELLWTPQSHSGTADTMWTLRYGRLDPTGIGTSGQTGTVQANNVVPVNTGVGSNAGYTMSSYIGGTDSAPWTIPTPANIDGNSDGFHFPITFSLERLASAAGDTMSGDALVYGLRIRRRR